MKTPAKNKTQGGWKVYESSGFPSSENRSFLLLVGWFGAEGYMTVGLVHASVVPNLIFNAHNNSLEIEGPKKPTRW